MDTGDKWVIGFEDDVACGAEATRKQIEVLTRHDCCLCVGSANHSLSWSDLYNPQDSASPLHHVINDRRYRVDEAIDGADRPPFSVATTREGSVVRLEFYAGHDALELTGDLRSPELLEVDLQPYLVEDPYAYDPVEFLAEVCRSGFDYGLAYSRYWKRRGIDPHEAGFQIRLSLPRDSESHCTHGQRIEVRPPSKIGDREKRRPEMTVSKDHSANWNQAAVTEKQWRLAGRFAEAMTFHDLTGTAGPDGPSWRVRRDLGLDHLLRVDQLHDSLHEEPICRSNELPPGTEYVRPVATEPVALGTPLLASIVAGSKLRGTTCAAPTCDGVVWWIDGGEGDHQDAWLVTYGEAEEFTNCLNVLFAERPDFESKRRELRVDDRGASPPGS